MQPLIESTLTWRDWLTLPVLLLALAAPFGTAGYLMNLDKPQVSLPTAIESAQARDNRMMGFMPFCIDPKTKTTRVHEPRCAEFAAYVVEQANLAELELEGGNHE